MRVVAGCSGSQAWRNQQVVGSNQMAGSRFEMSIPFEPATSSVFESAQERLKGLFALSPQMRVIAVHGDLQAGLG